MSDRTVTFQTTTGPIVARLFEAQAPGTTENFIGLVQSGFYDGLKFHRYVPGFVIQGGDPNGNGTGGSGRNIKLEVSSELKHDSAGMLAMARSGNPDSASSQFYFTLAPAPHLDMGYAVFGQVIDGLESVLALREGDTMTQVTLNEASTQE
jgi:peptidyl-prolyl cis-trans isomerase B (cyclophilin B)